MHDLFSVRGKTVLVTGGSRGIGLMIAQGFVAAGAHVIISSRKAETCAAVAEELSAHGRCEAIPADLGHDEGARGLAAAVRDRVDQLHVLVNNAGATWGAPLENYPESAFDKLWAINVKAAFRLTTELLPALRAAAGPDDPARVINIGSVDGLRVPAMEVYAYSATKAAAQLRRTHTKLRPAQTRKPPAAMRTGGFRRGCQLDVRRRPIGTTSSPYAKSSISFPTFACRRLSLTSDSASRIVSASACRC